MNKEINFADELETTPLGVEEENEEYQPFDPEKISIDTKPITMDTCLRRLEQGTIILNPDFQRNEVWTMEKKCRLIESLMLKIPIPMFYVSSDEKGIFYVVDGLQRLSTIRSFVLGDQYLKTKVAEYKGKGFKLEELEFWGKQYNDLDFNNLPINIQNRILETGFTFTIINPGTPEEVKRNIFKRINTGGEPLTSQEIRHALYIGESTKLLLKLSNLNSFILATDNSVRSERMMDRELILRFISFTIRSYLNYPKNNDMDKFLSDTMRIINVINDTNKKEYSKLFRDDINKEDILINDTSKLENLFSQAMKRAYDIFGKHAFRKSLPGQRRTPINKSLFEVWSVLLGRLTNSEFDKLVINKVNFIIQYSVLLSSDNFNHIISRDSLKYQSVNERYTKLTELLNQFI
ncbi:MAG TPA: DUF262 domain-containing protein [Ignavibacteria bacterium]|nr:DUF262 domain-containing protein [Ignavibacteria bacterium]HMQ98068.1 DUF262 domain-containing protein [Ignavibacteria bacterium]